MNRLPVTDTRNRVGKTPMHDFLFRHATVLAVTRVFVTRRYGEERKRFVRAARKHRLYRKQGYEGRTSCPLERVVGRKERRGKCSWLSYARSSLECIDVPLFPSLFLIAVAACKYTGLLTFKFDWIFREVCTGAYFHAEVFVMEICRRKAARARWPSFIFSFVEWSGPASGKEARLWPIPLAGRRIGVEGRVRSANRPVEARENGSTGRKFKFIPPAWLRMRK